MTTAIDLESALAEKTTFLEGRTRHTDTTGYFARLADYRDGGIFAATGALSSREPAGAQTENLEQMLRVTRQSLDRLRLLARRSDDRPKHKETALPKASTSKEQATTTDARPARADHDVATTSRLVEAVDSLVTLVDAPT